MKEAFKEAGLTAVGVTLVTGAVMTYAFDAERAGQASMLLAIGGLYAVLSVITLRRIHMRGELGQRFALVRGDITFAAVTAGVLYGGGRIACLVLAPHGSPHELWLMRVYLQLGAMPEAKLLGFAVGVVAAMEELVWRGLVMRALEDVMTPMRAAVATTALYTLAHASTLFLMRMPNVGPDPLIVLAAAGTGFVFAILGVRTGRLVPCLVAHALLTWSFVEFPLWQPAWP